MRLLFLNQYGPPDPAPTARLLGELAEGLRAQGHTVEVLSQTLSYQGRPARGGRLRRELAASWNILRAGWKPRSGDRRPDVVLALSSPPGLLVIAALLARRHRARLAHWAMDLYPELAVALGEIKPGSPVARLVGAAMRWAYRRAALVVALDEDMRDHLQAFCRVPVQVLPPWPDLATERQADEAANTAGMQPELGICLYSGNLGRAHEWHTLLDAQALLERRGLPVTLVFQGDGAGRVAAQAHADKLGLRRCHWKDYAPKEQLLPTLLAARVLVVTQRPETRGLLWPSKLALLERLPRPILFVGPEEGAIAQRLRRRGNAGIFAPGRAVAVANWIEELYYGPLSALSVAKGSPPVLSEQGLVLLKRWLEELPLD